MAGRKRPDVVLEIQLHQSVRVNRVTVHRRGKIAKQHGLQVGQMAIIGAHYH